MKEFMMIFRHTPNPSIQLTPEQIQESIKQWQDWMGGIAAQSKFIATSRLASTGKVLKANKIITDGPYAEVKEIIGGSLNVKASSIDDAMELAAGCPILLIGGSVEVRDVIKMD